jgi:protein phosphatase PTC1
MKQFVVGAPYTTETTIRPEDDFLIIACDGVRRFLLSCSLAKRILTVSSFSSFSSFSSSPFPFSFTSHSHHLPCTSPLTSLQLWDVISDQDAVDVIKSESDGQVASQKLLDYALKHGTTDNITVMVVMLNPPSGA